MKIKKINKKIIYLEHKNNYGPMINIFFNSTASAKRYVKSNKIMLEATYGKLGQNYHFENFILSSLDDRAI